ncbi:MAG: hypothetical protein PUB29_01280 [Bacteroidales bacterium]|nr:hypothetical protein [Bacteroidales bacterium]
MEKSTTILKDICLAMGMIAEGCKTLDLISEEEYGLVCPAQTEHLHIQCIYHYDNGNGETSDKPAGKKDENVTAYVSPKLLELLTQEVNRHQSQLAEWDHHSTQPVPWWSLSFDKNTGAVVEDEVYALCVKAAPMFKEVVK